jgi:hypothetical protein
VDLVSSMSIRSSPLISETSCLREDNAMAPVILPLLEDDERVDRETGEIPLIPADARPGMVFADEASAASGDNAEKRRFDVDGVGGGRVGGARLSSFSLSSAGGSSLVVSVSPIPPVTISIRDELLGSPPAWTGPLELSASVG